MSPSVLIIGAGPVGLALAAELALHRIPALVIEQNPRTGQQPRAKTTNVRTMEYMRRWGIAENIRAEAPLPAEYGTNISFRTRLFGHRFARIENAFYGARPVRDPLFSEPAQFIPQYKVEAVLRDHVQAQPGIALRFATRLEGLQQTAHGVTATVRDLESDAVSTIDAAYVVGADGARSVVRGLIGARMEGQHAYAQHMGLVIRAPGLREVMREDPAVMYWLINPQTPSVVSPMDVDDLWAFGFSIGVDASVTNAELQHHMAAAFGRQVPAEILTVDPWAAHSLLATHYASGRVFLAGDACHLHPPFGGYGMNLGIADAVDLGWKLAAMVQGYGGPNLLASYEIERRRVHRRVIDEAVANHSLLPHHLVNAQLEAEGPEGDAARQALGQRVRAEKIREFRTLGVVLGNHYSGSPIVVPDGTDPPVDDYLVYTPTAHPGCLAPHAWLSHDTSLYDLFGPGWTLLITAGGAEDAAESLHAAANSRGMPLTVRHRPAPDLADLYAARLALIRPDQHIAWRGDALDRPAAAIIDRVRGAPG